MKLWRSGLISWLVALILIAVVFMLMKYDFIVIDRCVFDFQISHILNRGRIRNLREYRAVLNAVEQRFDRDNEGFGSDEGANAQQLA